jgi:sporulation protein YlmC with PRC-barrel domain
MRATELKKMVVLDNRDVEIGKVSDICIDLDKFKVENILVSTGGFFSTKYYILNMEDLAEINNSIQLKCLEEDIDELSDVELKNSAYESYFFNDLQNIYVVSADAVTVGPVKELCIDLIELTFKIIIESTHGKFSKNDYFMIHQDDISDIREFIILKLKKDEIKQKTKEYDVKKC